MHYIVGFWRLYPVTFECTEFDLTWESLSIAENRLSAICRSFPFIPVAWKKHRIRYNNSIFSFISATHLRQVQTQNIRNIDGLISIKRRGLCYFGLKSSVLMNLSFDSWVSRQFRVELYKVLLVSFPWCFSSKLLMPFERVFSSTIVKEMWRFNRLYSVQLLSKCRKTCFSLDALFREKWA